MTHLHDPYRVLGLTRGASLDEVKRAYRRLAKELHPDSGGERTLERFLEIQAAYEQLITGRPARGGSAGGPGGARAPWQADHARADATRRAYGSRTRRSGSRTGGAAATPGDGPRHEEGRRRGRRKATLGSTSYDEAADQPFDPDWTGASWYGTTSGTYWTLNPREYADPRKHGPEYQARARRRSEEATNGTDADRPAPDELATDQQDAGAGPGWRPAAETSTGTEWSAAPGAAEPPSDGAGPGDRRPAGSGQVRTEDPAPLLPDLVRLLDPSTPRTQPARLGLAIVGGVPVVLWLAWLLGELTGCGRFSATCQPDLVSLSWIVGIALIAALVLLPGVATVLVVGALGALLSGIPATVVLTATGGARMPEESALVLGAALVVGWLAGVTLATRRWIGQPRPTGPVS